MTISSNSRSARRRRRPARSPRPTPGAATTPVREPGDLVALIPYQLGFVPRSSLVALGLTDAGIGASGRPRQLSMGVGRIDLPPDEAGCAPVAAGLARALRAGAPDAALVLVFGPDQRGLGEPPRRRYDALVPDDLARRTAYLFADELEASGIEVEDLLYVEDGRWCSLECWGSDCCPPEGRPVPAPHEVGAVADFVATGAAPVADREAVTGTARAGTDPVAVLVQTELARARARQRRAPVTDRTILRRWRQCLFDPAALLLADPRAEAPLPPAAVIARLVAELDSDDVRPGTALGLAADRPPRVLRDALVAWTSPDDGALATLPRDVLLLAHEVLGPRPVADAAGAAVLVDRLCAIVRCVPEPASARMCGLLAAVAWELGDMVRARAAVEQTLRLDPDHRMARLIGQALDAGMPPPGVR